LHLSSLTRKAQGEMKNVFKAIKKKLTSSSSSKDKVKDEKPKTPLAQPAAKDLPSKPEEKKVVKDEKKAVAEVKDKPRLSVSDAAGAVKKAPAPPLSPTGNSSNPSPPPSAPSIATPPVVSVDVPVFFYYYLFILHCAAFCCRSNVWCVLSVV
jgi:hypothetical protein